MRVSAAKAAQPRANHRNKEEDQRQADIVAGSHNLYTALSALIALILEHAPTDGEARRYGAYRKRVIDAMNLLVVRMKVVWDAYPLPDDQT